MVQLRKAQRTQAKIRLGLMGPSGSGKTMSALMLASGITSWDKIAIVDTENGSADLYEHLGAYSVLPLTIKDENGRNIQDPYSPERYIEAIKACEDAGMEVIIVDSISHAWAGAGGALEQQEKLGGRYQDWAKVKPRIRKLIDTILQSPCHVIVNARTKTDYAMDKMDGKTKITKMGLKAVFEEGLDYELTLAFDISINHLASASKDRTGIFMDQPERMISDEHGLKILKWANSGAVPKPQAQSVPEGQPAPKPVVSEPAKPSLTEENIKVYTEGINALETVEDAKKLYVEIKKGYSYNDACKALLDKITAAAEEIKEAAASDDSAVKSEAVTSNDVVEEEKVEVVPPANPAETGPLFLQDPPAATPDDTQKPKAKGRPKKAPAA